MANFKNYSFQNYNINIRVGDETRNLTRKATGDFSVNQRDEDIFTKKVYNDGEVVHNRRINPSGSMTLNYSQISPQCDYLDNLHQRMEKGDVQPTDVSIEIVDNLGNRVWEVQYVAVVKPADETFGTAVGTRTYNINASRITKTSYSV